MNPIMSWVYVSALWRAWVDLWIEAYGIGPRHG